MWLDYSGFDEHERAVHLVEAAKIEAFDRQGMAHTYYWTPYVLSTDGQRLAREEQDELQTEDAESAEQLIL